MKVRGFKYIGLAALILSSGWIVSPAVAQQDRWLDLAETLYGVARAEAGQGRLPEALEAMEDAAPRIETVRNAIGDRHPRALYRASRHEYYELWIDILMRLAEVEPGSDHAARAFGVHERSRARGLLEALNGTRTDLGPLALEQVQKQVLDAHTVLFEYALGEERSFLWMVTATSAATYKLPGRTTIEDLTRTVYQTITDRHLRPSETPEDYQERMRQREKEYRAAAAELSRILLVPSDPVEGHLDLDEIQRIVVVGEGILQYLPFGALPIPTVLPTAGDSQAPLGFQYEVISIPSASVIEALRRKRSAVGRRGGTKTPKILAVVADPALPISTGQNLSPFLVRSIRDIGLSRLIPLPGALDEAMSILRLVPPEQRLEALGLEANRDMVLAGGLRDYRIIHFATHSLPNSRHPGLSDIVLSLVDEEGRPQDGFLRLHDVYDLELTAELVVLSACQTALGQQILGEGLVGLTRGFIHAGVPAVIASLWSPDDEATAVLMKHFYEGMLKRGLTPAAALQEAQRTLFFEHPEWSSPYYWAPFVLQGDWLRGDQRHGS